VQDEEDGEDSRDHLGLLFFKPLYMFESKKAQVRRLFLGSKSCCALRLHDRSARS
jgi:hypothetical protein